MLGISGFFGDEILHYDEKKNSNAKCSKGFFFKNTCHVLKKNKLEVTIFKQ
jgi:hypothetical protein